MFLEYVAQKAIPPAATEVFGDLATQFYEGCIILKILDHRMLSSDNTSGPPKQEDGTENGDGSPPAAEPKAYTTVLRPTPLSMWHDLLYATDPHDWFSDHLALNIESELLKFSVRNIDLRVPKNPFTTNHMQVQAKRPLPGTMSKAEARQLFTHRQEVPRKRRQLHEDITQHGSEYEQLMSVMDEKPAQPSGQFMRLSFIENLRKKQKAARMNAMQNQMMQQQQKGQIQSPMDSQAPQQGSIFSQSEFADVSSDQSGGMNQTANKQQVYNGQPQQQVGAAMSPDNSYDQRSPPPASSPVNTIDTPKTRGKSARPRGKVAGARGASSMRGRGGKAGSSPSVGGKTVPGSNGSVQLGSPLYGAQLNSWENNRGQAGKMVPGKTVPGKTVPGKTVPGKPVAGKTVPGKKVPGNASRAKGKK